MVLLIHTVIYRCATSGSDSVCESLNNDTMYGSIYFDWVRLLNGSISNIRYSRCKIIPTWSLERLNYETSELNIFPEEARLSHIGDQYSSKEAQIFPYEAKTTSKIMEYRQRLFIYDARPDTLILNTIEICRLSRPKSSHNLSSGLLESTYEGCEK